MVAWPNKAITTRCWNRADYMRRCSNRSALRAQKITNYWQRSMAIPFLSRMIFLFAFVPHVLAASGPALISDLNPGSTGSFPSNLTASANFLFFDAYTLDTGRELWKTDGTNITLV